LVAEEALQHQLGGRFISAGRDGHTIGPDQLLQQLLQVALERVDEPARVARGAAAH
jgi:hypothetical protein